MTEKHIIALLFFLISIFSLIAMIREVFPSDKEGSQNEEKKERVTVSIKNQAGSLVDNVSEEIVEEEEENNTSEEEKEQITTKVNVVDVISEIDSDILEKIKESSLKKYEETKENIQTTVNNIPETSSDILENIKESSSEVIEEIKEEVKENIVQNITVFVEETIYVSYDMIVDKISETIINPIKERFISLAKSFISDLLSLLSPEEVLEIFDKELEGVDICKS